MERKCSDTDSDLVYKKLPNPNLDLFEFGTYLVVSTQDFSKIDISRLVNTYPVGWHSIFLK